MSHSRTDTLGGGRNLDFIVISTLLLICGMVLAIGLMNLPLPNTDPVTDPTVRQILTGFALGSLSLGAAGLIFSFTGLRKETWFLLTLLFVIGISAIGTGCGLSVICYPYH